MNDWLHLIATIETMFFPEKWIELIINDNKGAYALDTRKHPYGIYFNFRNAILIYEDSSKIIYEWPDYFTKKRMPKTYTKKRNSFTLNF